jgi:ketosteroid isomerase-like protein
MSDMTDGVDEVFAAAHGLVDSFDRFDRTAYFAAFDEGASFIFYNSDITFDDRASYEKAWDEWADAGWRVLHCRSVGAKVRMLNDDIAIFTHEVFTTLGPAGEPTDLHERETIVFSKRPPGWIAVHEHLSPFPEES